MKKNDIKEIKKHLSLFAKIKITGKKAFSVSQTVYNKIKKHFILQKAQISFVVEENKKSFEGFINNNKDNLNEYVETDKALKLAEIKEQRENFKNIIGNMQQDDEYRIGNKKLYLDAMNQELLKLNKKQVKINKKGLGIFAVSKLAIVKFGKTKKDKLLKNIINKKENDIASRQEELARKYTELMTKIEKFQEENNVVLNLDNSPTKLVEDSKTIENTSQVGINQNSEKFKQTVNEGVKVKKIRKSVNSETLKRKIIALGLAAILLTSLNINHQVTNKKTEEDFKTPIIEQLVKNDLGNISPAQISELDLGSLVKINSNTPIYETAADAAEKNNPKEAYYKDDDNRVAEAFTYMIMDKGNPQYFTVWYNDRDAQFKINTLKNKGASLVSVLVTKSSLANDKLHEGFKSIEDVYFMEKVKSK